MPASGALLDDRSPAEGEPLIQGELLPLWSMAWPVSLSGICRLAMGLTDISVVGHLGVEELAACALANVWMNFTLPVVQTAGSVLTTFVSQALGAEQHQLCGEWLQLSLLCTSLFCVPVGLSWTMTARVLGALGSSPRVCELAQTFNLISLTWLLPNGLYWTSRMYLQALGHVKLPMVVNVTFVFVNLLLNVVFVHGVPGVWSGLGFIGSPVATSLSRWLQPLAMLALVRYLRPDNVRKTWQGWRRSAGAGRRLARFLGMYVPSCLGTLLETSALQIVTVFASRFGNVEAGTNSALQALLVMSLAGSFGLSYALGQRVGFHLGARQPMRAQKAARAGMALCASYGIAIGLGVFVARYRLGYVFSDDPEVVALVPHLAWLCSFGFFFLSQVTAIGGVMNGQGRPLPVMFAGFFSIWGVALPSAWAIGFKAQQRLPGLWDGLMLGYVTYCLLLAIAFCASDWPKLAMEAQVRSERRHAGATAERGPPAAGPCEAAQRA